MSDTLERRLRESMERRARDVHVPALAPPHLLRRARRRQVWVSAMAGLTAAVVVAASVIGARSLLLNQGRGDQLGDQTTTTQTVRGVSVTFPRQWYFENAVAGTRGTALFIVANYPPRVPFVSLQDSDVCTATAAVMAVQDHSFGGRQGTSPHWPVELRPGGVQVPGCAESLVANWTVFGRQLGAAVLFGKDVSATDRAAMETAFRNLRFGPTPSGAPPIPSPSPSGTVLARGTNAGTSWIVTVDNHKGQVSLNVGLPGQGIGIGVPRGPGGQVPVLSPESVPLGSGPGTRVLVFGFVSHRVSSVHIEPTHEIATIYPIPGQRQLMAFLVVTGRSSNAMVVAENEGGKVLAQEPVGPPTPHPHATPLTSTRPKASPSP
jgi:hypothetical protein